MAGRSAERRERVTRGTGNVFADLGFPDAAERQAKRRLAYALNQVLDGRKLSQADAAKVLGTGSSQRPSTRLPNCESRKRLLARERNRVHQRHRPSPGAGGFECSHTE
jgi:hypothetical protein